MILKKSICPLLSDTFITLTSALPTYVSISRSKQSSLPVENATHTMRRPHTLESHAVSEANVHCSAGGELIEKPEASGELTGDAALLEAKEKSKTPPAKRRRCKQPTCLTARPTVCGLLNEQRARAKIHRKPRNDQISRLQSKWSYSLIFTSSSLWAADRDRQGSKRTVSPSSWMNIQLFTDLEL